MKRIAWIAFVLLCASSWILADVPRPDKQSKQKSVDTYLMIRLDRDAKEARLVIPKSQLAQLRAALDEVGDGSDVAAMAGGISRTQTIVSGIFLSLAIAFGGVWFVRSKNLSPKTGKTIAAVAVLAAMGSTATFVFANAGPPPEARSITGKMFSPAVHIYKFGSGRVKLELTDDDAERITLIVPDPKDDKTAE